MTEGAAARVETRPAPAITVDDIGFRYGTHVALSGVSFQVEAGEIFGLLGPNGGGKTTLFRILSTLVMPQSGRANVLGHDLAGARSQVRERLGVVFQNPSVYAKLTVL